MSQHTSQKLHHLCVSLSLADETLKGCGFHFFGIVLFSYNLYLCVLCSFKGEGEGSKTLFTVGRFFRVVEKFAFEEGTVLFYQRSIVFAFVSKCII